MQPYRHLHSKSLKRLSLIILVLLVVVSWFVSWPYLHEPMDQLMASLNTVNIPQRKKSLIFVTTHLSETHYTFFEKCWPSLLAKGDIYRQSDFLVLITLSEGTEPNWEFLNATFANTNYTAQVVKNPGYHQGAVLALTKGYLNNWFDDYEWVIRVNPDVLIRNDSFLFERMDDAKIQGVFADCFNRDCPTGNHCSSAKIHTDFFAIRPEAVSLQDVMEANKAKIHAELMATQAFSGIVNAGTDSWVPDAGPHNGNCRIRGEASPVIHTNVIRNVYPACLSWYD